MDLMELNMPVTLVVKAPNQRIADQTVECALGWTIKKLKEHLASVYPSKPREHQQKLIYSGRLLMDHLTLKDVLRQYDEDQTTHTVHLVCSQMLADNTSHLTDRSQDESQVPSPGSAPSTDGVRHRHVHNAHVESAPSVPQPSHAPSMSPQEAFQQFAGPNMMYNGFYPPGMMAYSPEQMMWMQHMYTQQMAQFMQYYQQGGFPAAPTSPAPAPAADPAQAEQNAGQNQPANRRAEDQPIRLNAQGGVDMDDDDMDMNRDWLDWLYTMSRFSVFLSIVYFYSTFNRFMVVFGLFVLFYLFEGGWLQLRRRRERQNRRQEQEQQQQQQQQQQQEQQQQQQQQEQQQAAEPEQQEGEDQAENSQDTQAQQETEQPAPPPGPGPLQLTWSFISTFFSSLIPTQPPQVNAN